MNETKGRTVCFLVSVFCLLLCLLTPAEAETLPETARLVPPETVLLVDISDFGRLKTQFEGTNFYKLYKAPAMAAFVEDFRNKLRETIRKHQNEVAAAIVDADILPEGRVAAALVLTKEAGPADEPAFLLVTQWGEKVSRIREAVEKEVKKAVEEGCHKKSEDYRGVNIVTIIKELPPRKVPDHSRHGSQGGDEPPMRTIQPPPEKIHYCLIDDSLVVSSSIDVLRFAVAHIKGVSSPTLGGDADYIATVQALRPDRDITLYVNIKHIVRTLAAEDTSGKTKTAAGNLGLDNVASFGCHVAVSRLPGSSLSGKAFLKINGAKRGVCKMLEAESAAIRPPRFVPESTCAATFYNLNIRHAYSELVNILTRFSPQAATVMFMPLPTSDSPDKPGLKIKDDIIDYLGSQILFVQSVKKPFSAKSNPTESLVALAVDNRKALEKSLSVLHSKILAPNNPDASRELLGHTIYLVKMPGFPFFRPGRTPMQGPAAPVAPQIPTMAFTVTDTHLIFGVESSVERAIRRLSSAGAPSISSTRWFASARSALPSVVGLASVQDNAASSELSWRMMKESAKSKSAQNGPAMHMGVGVSSSLNMVFSQAGLDLFDFNLLPEFEAVRRYFGLSASYGISRPDGFFFEFKYLDPSASD
ncbi:MAG: hypothetical protein ACYS4W_06880 [Planctomycetota bacterium]|jgi:hypothetical protein